MTRFGFLFFFFLMNNFYVLLKRKNSFLTSARLIFIRALYFKICNNSNRKGKKEGFFGEKTKKKFENGKNHANIWTTLLSFGVTPLL